jgi:hypothetical protein
MMLQYVTSGKRTDAGRQLRGVGAGFCYPDFRYTLVSAGHRCDAVERSAKGTCPAIRSGSGRLTGR